MKNINKKLVKKLLKQNKQVISLLKDIKKKQKKFFKETEMDLSELSVQERVRRRSSIREISEDDTFED